MRKILIVFFILVLSTVGIAQKKIRRLISYPEYSMVFVTPGSGIYHTQNCALLGNARTGMALNLAKEKGFSPCSGCFYEEVEIQAEPKAEPESIPMSSSSKSLISTGGFRGVRWGAPLSEVQKAEKSEFIKKDKIEGRGLIMAAYKGSMGGRACIIGYIFAYDQLVEGRYIFLEKHSNNNLFISDLDEIKESIIEKYGAPVLDKTEWNNDLYKNDPDEWGMALAVGHLSFFTGWLAKDAEIQLLLKGDNFDITLMAVYSSNAHGDLVKKAEAEAKKSIW